MVMTNVLDSTTNMVNGLQTAVTGAGLPEMTAAVRAFCKTGMTPFAETLLILLEVTAQLTELDGTSQEASMGYAGETDEARKWREISATTLRFCRDNLVERQLQAIEKLQELSSHGGSLAKEADAVPAVLDAPRKACAVGPPPGLGLPTTAAKPPPGLQEPFQEHSPARKSAETLKKEAPWRRSGTAAKTASKIVTQNKGPSLSALAPEFRPAAVSRVELNLDAYGDISND